ncbi:glycerone kinase [Propionibacterium ruminifibrarum]|uniref:Glycerone kinase n=1 Tax=Propionibacterium ruminifibrarum TaxID=1962131 RepID=A0A375HZZ0_9ACTN|nr:dihydroxyacetone kinase subunit DhaL [Propionibacterium ruminifibrarum]SPF67925.1 glycerone kinase [Propionibacterium ruminifibrarum]
MASTIDLKGLVTWLELADAVIAEHADELTQLDAAIGDADHGTNMRRGMAAAVEAVAAGQFTTADAMLKKVGMTLVSTVGGASGPLYGTFFLRMGGALAGKDEIDAAALAAAVEAGIGGLVQRGKAAAGEKTMLDAWYPALEALTAHPGDVAEATRAAADAAAAGRDATEPMIATKGRASYLGERSTGHIDPGAASTALLLDALARAAAGETA